MPGTRALATLALSLAFGCSDKAESAAGEGGTSGTSTGGTSGAGTQGGAAGSSASGGTSATGGVSASGGTTATGGVSASGGTTATGGSGVGGMSGVGGDGGVGAVGSGAGGAAGSGTATGGASGAGASAGTGPGGKGGGGQGGGGTSAGGRGGSGNAGAGGGAMQVPFKGVANSPCNVRTALGVAWYYNWTQSGDTCAAGGEFVPMIWGHTGAEQTANGISSAVTTFVSRGNKNVLAFNEPDNPTQSNIPVNTAISLWPSFGNPAIRIGSPGTAANANPGQAWFTNFMTQLNGNASLRADFLAIHWYGWNAGSCDASASQLESYVRWAENFAGNRPIWITEFGCLNQSRPDRATVLAFYRGALAMFARHPRIERYAWYPWETNLELANTDGSLTELGMAYAAAPAVK